MSSGTIAAPRGYTAALERAAILAALDAWIRQRPGLEYGNYGNVTNYRAEVRHIGQQLRDARELLRAVELRPSIGAPELRKAFSAYNGRLTWRAAGETCDTCRGTGELGTEEQRVTRTLLRDCYTCQHAGKYQRSELDYCTGQYWPTEYRAAACAVLASALWAYWRADMKPDGKRTETFSYGIGTYEVDTYNGLRFADAVQKVARRELSRGVVSRWVR